MLENIFLMNLIPENNSNEINSDNFNNAYLAYPDEDILFDSNEIVRQIIISQKTILEKNYQPEHFTDDFLHANSKAIQVNGVNLLVIPLPYQYILGLVFKKDANPYDYRNELIRLFQEYLMVSYLETFEKVNKTDKIKNKSNLLLTLFIDIRKYDDESLVFQKEINKVMIDSNSNPLVKVFVYGIDFAGKSSLMRLLSTGKFNFDYFPPTKKFRITNVKLDSGVKLVCWDMPGQKIFRSDWLRGAQASNLLLYVLDCADSERFLEAKEELWNMLNLYELKGIPLLFLVNKTDLPGCDKNLKVISEKFKLNDIHDRDWQIIFSSLPKRAGINELIDWMENQVDNLLLINGIKTIEDS
ncbi:ADP-ribosylation factor-like protein [Promethearchaeum syntrophicum]|uniref:ADP-ribosylation factor-like protein n=1 Tax=Promethearchaeum syntrophicum TaxID=2594042 RepID=A0A5B9D9Y4_9ARCH|nr:ADP-ribosylation factor-like protein [Candidatus Prometheoarchaeum syntrophicum]QEE15831.1 GTPase Obg [Candidatus Prometheoarchaeum syntrophicum]